MIIRLRINHANSDTLSWSVGSQPWHDGDELMVRVQGFCRNGTAVPNPRDNPALMRDCINLLAAKDTLRGTATLNWSEDTAITSWDGVRVKGSPGRVTEVLLTSKGLTGTIPPGLARLDGLEFLWLNVNQLAGAIPSELGSLASLQTLILNDNRLTGAVPRELGGLSSLETLWLNRNRLSGRDSVGAGGPRQPAEADPLGQPAVRRHPVGSGRPDQPGDICGSITIS